MYVTHFTRLSVGLAILAVCSLAPHSVDAADTRLSITDLGAVPDGKTLNTAAIQKAIDQLAKDGGGTLVIPAGAFLSGAVFLKPSVNLHLDQGAVLKGSTDTADYPTTRTRIEGHFQDWLPALINAIGCDHLRITADGGKSGQESDGGGMLDGSGQPYWTAFRTKLTADRSTKNLDVPRPRLMFLQDCHDVQITGLHLKDSGFWNLHLYRCDNVTIDNVDIRAGRGSPSTDGIDIDSSQNITVTNTFVSNNDDCIAFKGSKGPFAMQDKDSPPVEHIRVSNCIFAGGGGITCGSEATIVRDVIVDSCTFSGRVSSVLRLKLRVDTPQLYEDIHYKNITLDGTGALVAVDPWRQYFDLQGQPQPNRTVRNISVSDVQGSFGNFGNIRPNPGDTVKDVTFENIDIKLSPNRPPVITGVENLVAKNIRINGQSFTPTVTTSQPATQP
jgi:alpha-L-rhamnosidase